MSLRKDIKFIKSRPLDKLRNCELRLRCTSRCRGHRCTRTHIVDDDRVHCSLTRHEHTRTQISLLDVHVVKSHHLYDYLLVAVFEKLSIRSKENAQVTVVHNVFASHQRSHRWLNDTSLEIVIYLFMYLFLRRVVAAAIVADIGNMRHSSCIQTVGTQHTHTYVYLPILIFVSICCSNFRYSRINALKLVHYFAFNSQSNIDDDVNCVIYYYTPHTRLCSGSESVRIGWWILLL